MIVTLCVGLAGVAVAMPSFAQDIVVSPFLQSPTPTDIWIVWETSTGSESRVEWGTTEALGTTTEGSDHLGNGSSRIHDVQLTGLTPATRYFYRVRTGSATSEIFDFTSPPLASAEESFRIVAMSDMQRGEFGMFRQIMQDGIRAHVTSEYGPNLSEELALMLIPGDLVASGPTYSEWGEEFFAPGAGVFEHVPMYPVIGNHEEDSDNYFNYFHLPENGSAGSIEHWYHADYSNVRIIGLDSNGGYRTETQLTWLDAVLDDTCMDPDIDFVFAQMHHPYLSELWAPGQTSYSGQIVRRLEAFSTACGKPSIHMFGHTHAYSRGQSRDHRHLWVNVATAEGDLDNWGEYPGQQDYDEFTISEPQWGFVVLEVSAGDDPSFRLRRYSRGDEDTPRDNEIRDDLTIRLNNEPPNAPTLLGPIGDMVPLSCKTLSATPFFDADGERHDASHWQLSFSCDDWNNLESESWKQHQNIYYDEDLQAGDDLTDDDVAFLEGDTDYCARVRYRDASLGWSDWSEPLSFHTASDGGSSENLLTNPGAEDGITGWTVTEGFLESLDGSMCSGVPPHSGELSFAVGGVCQSAAMASAYQRVDVSDLSAEIDANEVEMLFGGYLRSFEGSDLPAAMLIYRDAGGTEIGRSETISRSASAWMLVQANVEIPATTRNIDFVITGTRNGGEDNDSYADDLFLRRVLGGMAGECETREPPMNPDAGPGADSGPGVDGGPAVDGGRDSGTDGGSSEDGGADASGTDAGTGEEEGGCGCRLATRTGQPWPLLLLLPLLVLRRRRRA